MTTTDPGACPVEPCKLRNMAGYPMCRRHWALVPAWRQKAVLEAAQKIVATNGRDERSWVVYRRAVDDAVRSAGR